MRKQAVVLTLLTFFSAYGIAQAQYASEYENGFRLNISDDERKYLKLTFWNQIWMRSIENNPGTSINGIPSAHTFDIGARRLRMLLTGQITSRFMIMAHLGVNNQTFINGGAAGTQGTGGYGAGKKPGIFFHDFVSEYTIFPTLDPETDAKNFFSFYLGAGLHSYMGLSRISMVSTATLLTLDSPIFSFPLVENSDQFVRLYGLYAKGKMGNLAYRLSMNKPFATNVVPTEENVAVDHNGVSELSAGGYFEYQFFDQESDKLPFKVGSYLGSKKVVNLGLGFYHQNNGTKSLQHGLEISHPISLKALDLFLDLPMGSGTQNMALTSYTGFFDYDFGPNYLRHFGTMNLGSVDPEFTGNRSISGPGNSSPMIGTGTILYNQTGFKLPNFTGRDIVRFQPFVAYTHGQFEALAKPSTKWDWGLNLLISEHNAKISAQYSLRPNFTSPSYRDGYLGQFTLQFQTML